MQMQMMGNPMPGQPGFMVGQQANMSMYGQNAGVSGGAQSGVFLVFRCLCNVFHFLRFACFNLLDVDLAVFEMFW